MSKFDVSQLERIDMYVKDFDPQKFHKLAHMHPGMTELEFVALKEDISINGQLVPILVYRGKIVDGRHRWRALNELGSEKIKVWKIPHNFSIDAVEEIVVGMENRRHESKSQKAIRAWRMWKSKGGTTQQEAALKYGVSYKLVREVEQIFKMRGEVLIDSLFEGHRYNLISGRSTDSLPAIVKDIKERIAYETRHDSEYDEPSSSYLDTVEEDNLVNEVVEDIIKKLDGKRSEIYKEVANKIYKKYDQLSEQEKQMQDAYVSMKDMR